MINLTPVQMIAALRQCGTSTECDGCPYQEMLAAKCIQQMQKDAAAMIEGQQTILDQQAGKLARIQELIPTA